MKNINRTFQIKGDLLKRLIDHLEISTKYIIEESHPENEEGSDIKNHLLDILWNED